MDESAVFAEWTEELADDPDCVVHDLLCDITEEICAAMDREGMSRADLARCLDVSPQYISEFLNTPHNTTLKQIVRFAAAVGLEVRLELTLPAAEISRHTAATTEESAHA
jgi:transcriptional regulator with XRE-family HTH domain